MLINLRNEKRQPLWVTRIKANDRPAVLGPESSDAAPEGDAGCAEHPMHWDNAFDNQGQLVRCPACDCREMFVRRDFPQTLGIAVVVAAAITALVLFASNRAMWAMGVLGATVVVDGVIVLFMGKCLVCYRCRSEFRETPISEKHRKWDLATGEKYRSVWDEPSS